MRTVASRCTTLLAISLLTGCGAGVESMHQDVAKLHTELARVRADNAVLAERVHLLELARQTNNHGAEAQPTMQLAASDRPELQVVHLSPGDDEGSPEAVQEADQAEAPLQLSLEAPTTKKLPGVARKTSGIGNKK